MNNNLEIKPTSPAEELALKQFEELTPEQRAELIMLGLEYLARIYQRNADRVYNE